MAGQQGEPLNSADSGRACQCHVSEPSDAVPKRASNKRGDYGNICTGLKHAYPLNLPHLRSWSASRDRRASFCTVFAPCDSCPMRSTWPSVCWRCGPVGRARFSDGALESGDGVRERHICPTLSSLWPFVPSGLAGSQSLMGLVWLCLQKRNTQTLPGTATTSLRVQPAHVHI